MNSFKITITDLNIPPIYVEARFHIIIFFLLLFLFAKPIRGEDKNQLNKISLGIEVGTWRPNNLRDTNASFSLKFSKEHLYSGFFLNTPLNNNWALRISIGYYDYSDPEQNSIILIPILVDIKYALLSGARISPFVSYGIGTCVGHHNNSKILSFQFTKENLGYGLNLGTGFDFLISSHWATGIEFRYQYLKFSKVLIFTDDYSGPKITLTLYYFLK